MTLLSANPAHESLPELEDHRIRRMSMGSAALLCISLLALWQLAPAGWVWHDRARLVDDIRLRSVIGLRSTWLHPLSAWTTATDVLQFDQPIAQTLYWVEHQFFGAADAIGYRCVSALLHTFNAILVWVVLRRLGILFPWWTASLFALHPASVSTTALIVNQPFLLSIGFGLLSTVVFMRASNIDPLDEGATDDNELPMFRLGLPNRPWMLWALTIVVLVLAVLSDMDAWVFPLVWMCLLWWKSDRINWRHWTMLIVVALAAIGFVGMVSAAQSTPSTPINPAPMARMLLFPKLFWLSMLRTFWPGRVALVEPLIIAGWASYAATAGLVAFVIAALRLRRKWGKTPVAALIAFSLLLVPSVVSADLIGDEAAIGDRSRYLAVVAPCAFAVIAVAAIYKRRIIAGIDLSDLDDKQINWHRQAALLAGALGIAVVGAMSLLRLSAYRNEVQVWKQTASSYPDSAIVGNEFGVALLSHERTQAGVLQFEQVLAAHPHDAAAMVNMAKYHASEKNFPEAIAFYDRAITVRPNDVSLYDGKADAYAASGDVAEALRVSNKALKIDPKDASAHNQRGVLLATQGKFDDAILHYHRALEIQPYFIIARINLASAYQHKGDLNAAAGNLLQVIELDPENYDGYNAGGIILGQLGRHDKAAALFRRAIQCRPDSAEAYNSLGAALEAQGEINQARFMFKQALSLNPKFELAQSNLDKLQLLPPSTTTSANIGDKN